ncbi:hypothetical protein HDZ31DRAFT_65028 [Schizophyllum fasciatum]
MELNLEGSEGEPERILAEDEEPTLQVTEEEDIALDLDVLELEEDDDGYEEDVEVTEDEDNRHPETTQILYVCAILRTVTTFFEFIIRIGIGFLFASGITHAQRESVYHPGHHPFAPSRWQTLMQDPAKQKKVAAESAYSDVLRRELACVTPGPSTSIDVSSARYGRALMLGEAAEGRWRRRWHIMVIQRHGQLRHND